MGRAEQRDLWLILAHTGRDGHICVWALVLERGGALAPSARDRAIADAEFAHCARCERGNNGNLEVSCAQ